MKKRMRQFLKVLISITGVTLVHTAAIAIDIPKVIAQEADNCFMVNSSGKVINLTQLCGGTSRGALKPSGVFQAKIKRRVGGTPVIDVTFNGGQKFEMLLDTGATQTTITPKMANALGLVPDGVEKAHVASGDVVEFPTGHVNSIEIDGAVLKDPVVSVGAVPLLGQNFFGGYDVIIRRDVVEFHVQQS